MFGIDFTGHDALDPLLLPDGFEGHPLRKDFVLASRVAKPWPGAKEPGESDRDAVAEPAPYPPARRPRPRRVGASRLDLGRVATTRSCWQTLSAWWPVDPVVPMSAPTSQPRSPRPVPLRQGRRSSRPPSSMPNGIAATTAYAHRRAPHRHVGQRLRRAKQEAVRTDSLAPVPLSPAAEAHRRRERSAHLPWSPQTASAPARRSPPTAQSRISAAIVAGEHQFGDPVDQEPTTCTRRHARPHARFGRP